MAKRKPANRDRTRGKPLTLAVLEEYGALSGIQPPSGEFDPNGTWKHSYRLWLVASGGLTPKPADVHYRGYLEIDRKPLDDDKQVAITVRQSILQQAPGVHDTVVEMRCAADAVASPRWWKLTHNVLDGRLKPIRKARVEQSGTLSGESLRIDHGDGRVRQVRLPPGQLTSHWSLFDAVQRLPRETMAPLEFTLLQELDEIKPSQRIAYRGLGQHTWNGRGVRLHHYQHVGAGILPYDYYTDPQGRLLLAVGGLRAYVFDPGASELHAQCLAQIAERAQQ